jgi:SAM-dependent methyltransferase
MATKLSLDPEREEAELREYLGQGYDRALLERHEARIEEEFAACDDEDAFYRESEAYLYDLTVFAMSGTKLPYLERLASLVPPGSRVLDYGCGIGSDGLALLESGYRVEFADFDNPSVAYLRWRLRRRGLEAPVHDLDRGVPGGFDAAYAFDVIEHVPDPFEFLAELERRADLVLVNLLESRPGEIALHHELPVNRLLRHAIRQRLRYYGIHHGASHLVAYAAGRPGVIERGAASVRVAAPRLRRRLRGLVRARARPA